MRIAIAVILMTAVEFLASPIVSAQTVPQAVHESATPIAQPEPLFDYQEVMVPMRDGVRLQTCLLYTSRCV